MYTVLLKETWLIVWVFKTYNMAISYVNRTWARYLFSIKLW